MKKEKKSLNTPCHHFIYSISSNSPSGDNGCNFLTRIIKQETRIKHPYPLTTPTPPIQKIDRQRNDYKTQKQIDTGSQHNCK